MSLRGAKVLWLTMLPLPAVAYPDDVPAAHSGGFGEPTCTVCHQGSLGGAPPRLTLDGLPVSTTPGRRHRIVIRIRHEQLARAGFTVTARYRDGRQAGCFSGAELTASEGIVYASQMPDATWFDERAHWQLVWQAPTEPGKVTFNVAANAANGDDSAFGDSIASLALHVVVEARPFTPDPTPDATHGPTRNTGDHACDSPR